MEKTKRAWSNRPGAVNAAPETLAAVRADHEAGMSYFALGKKYGVAASTVARWIGKKIKPRLGDLERFTDPLLIRQKWLIKKALPIVFGSVAKLPADRRNALGGYAECLSAAFDMVITAAYVVGNGAGRTADDFRAYVNAALRGSFSGGGRLPRHNALRRRLNLGVGHVYQDGRDDFLEAVTDRERAPGETFDVRVLLDRLTARIDQGDGGVARRRATVLRLLAQGLDAPAIKNETGESRAVTWTDIESVRGVVLADMRDHPADWGVPESQIQVYTARGIKVHVTPEQLARMRRQRKEGLSIQALARQHGLNRGTVQRLLEASDDLPADSNALAG